MLVVDDPAVSLVCVYNKKDMFDQMVASAQNQTAGFEVIGIANTDHRFSSAASALNWGGAASQGKSGCFPPPRYPFREAKIPRGAYSLRRGGTTRGIRSCR